MAWGTSSSGSSISFANGNRERLAKRGADDQLQQFLELEHLGDVVVAAALNRL